MITTSPQKVIDMLLWNLRDSYHHFGVDIIDAHISENKSADKTSLASLYSLEQGKFLQDGGLAIRKFEYEYETHTFEWTDKPMSFRHLVWALAMVKTERVSVSDAIDHAFKNVGVGNKQ